MKNTNLIFSLIFLANSVFAMDMDWESTYKDTEEKKETAESFDLEKLPEEMIASIILKKLDNLEYPEIMQQLQLIKQVSKKIKKAASSHIIKEIVKNKATKQLEKELNKSPKNWGKMKQLILDGANVNSTINKSSSITALHCAVDNNGSGPSKESIEVARLLINNGANVDARNLWGHTPLRWTVRLNISKEMIELLLASGAGINSKDEDGSTVFLAVACYHDIEIIQILLNKKADPNIKDKDNKTALDYAIATNNSKVQELLRQHGAKRGNELP